MKPPAFPPRLVDEKILSDQHYVLKKITYELGGKKVARESYDMGDGAAILLFNRQARKVILTRQFRIPTFVNGNVDGYLIEACAGKLDHDTPEACAIKEAKEELGYTVTNPQKVFSLYTSPGAVTEIIHLFMAEVTPEQKTGAGGGLESEGERIETLEIDFETAWAWVRSGQIRDAKTVLLLQHLYLQSACRLR